MSDPRSAQTNYSLFKPAGLCLQDTPQIIRLHTSIRYKYTPSPHDGRNLPHASDFWWINSCSLRKCHFNNDPCVCVSFHYLISCKYSCVWSASCGLHVWKPYAQWDKLALCRTIIQWNNIYRSAFRAVANGFWAQAGKRLGACVYVSVQSRWYSQMKGLHPHEESTFFLKF